jgi:xylose isomerase
MMRVLVCMQLASAYGKLGNIDANTGDAQTGWDTDQFLTDPKEALLVAATILKQGGLAPGTAHLGSAEWVIRIDRSSTFQQIVHETPSACPLV